jgi:hypothetical protein
MGLSSPTWATQTEAIIGKWNMIIGIYSFDFVCWLWWTFPISSVHVINRFTYDLWNKFRWWLTGARTRTRRLSLERDKCTQSSHNEQHKTEMDVCFAHSEAACSQIRTESIPSLMLSCKPQIQHSIERTAEPQSTMYNIPPHAHKSPTSTNKHDENM